MRQIQASEAKTHLPQLLDEVEHGETILITRHGRPIARLMPETGVRQREVDQLVEKIKAFGKRNGRITAAELLSVRDEGRRA